MMENELKPCAHCGGEAIVHPDDYVECRKCGVQTSIMANRSNAIAAWNARAGAPTIDAGEVESQTHGLPAIASTAK